MDSAESLAAARELRLQALVNNILPELHRLNYMRMSDAWIHETAEVMAIMVLLDEEASALPEDRSA